MLGIVVEYDLRGGGTVLLEVHDSQAPQNMGSVCLIASKKVASYHRGINKGSLRVCLLMLTATAPADIWGTRTPYLTPLLALSALVALDRLRFWLPVRRFAPTTFLRHGTKHLRYLN